MLYLFPIKKYLYRWQINHVWFVDDIEKTVGDPKIGIRSIIQEPKNNKTSSENGIAKMDFSRDSLIAQKRK